MNNQYAVLISSEIPELGELDLLRSIYRELNGYMEDYKECNFRKSKLVINADDAIFENCCFIDAKFGIITYGYEYGGRRTKFYNCDFTGAEFKNVEFRYQSSIIAILQEQDLSVVICEELNLKEMNLK